MEEHGVGLVLIGEAADLIADRVRGRARCPIVRAGAWGMPSQAARELAQPGDAVLLAPACASFDMFRSYAHRGDVFRDEVLALPRRSAHEQIELTRSTCSAPSSNPRRPPTRTRARARHAPPHPRPSGQRPGTGTRRQRCARAPSSSAAPRRSTGAWPESSAAPTPCSSAP